MILLNFPSFNIYSTPLLILVLQGLIFFVLLLRRYFEKKNLSDLLLAIILLITCWHQTTYTIGFMGWYDTFRNTKVNYILVNLSLAIGPLIYFYVKSVTHSNFCLSKKDYLHFIPVAVFIFFKIFVFGYDAMQPGFSETQNGVIMNSSFFEIVNVLQTVFFNFQMILYLAFAIQMYFQYRQKIQQVFSNVYTLELNWLRNFLFLYSFLFLYGTLQGVVNMAITDLSYTQEWWYFFFSSLAIIYIGIKGYFTQTDKLNEIDFNNTTTFQITDTSTKPSINSTAVKTINAKESLEVKDEILIQKEKLDHFMKAEKPYLNPELNLIDLAKDLRMTRAQLSEVINLGHQKNFNDFINEFRVEAVKKLLAEGKQEQLSLLGIAYECGFNSKATFNRVFKKITGTSPTVFLKMKGERV